MRVKRFLCFPQVINYFQTFIISKSKLHKVEAIHLCVSTWHEILKKNVWMAYWMISFFLGSSGLVEESHSMLTDIIKNMSLFLSSSYPLVKSDWLQ